MYCSYDFGEGLPPRLYRTPEQIKADITDIAERINEIYEMINIRNIISEVISESCEEDLLSRIKAVNELLESAENALFDMKMMEKDIDMLREELFDAVSI